MKRIAILIETSLASGRHMLNGVASFVRERNDWSLFKHSGQLGAFEPESIRGWKGDGIIARITSDSVYEAVKSLEIPVVDVLGNLKSSHYPTVVPNHPKIGEMAAEHFLQKSFQNLAFYGSENEKWSRARFETFQRSARKAGAFCESKLDSDRMTSQSDWFSELSNWLKQLPKPVGLLIASDQYAPEIFEAAHQALLALGLDVSRRTSTLWSERREWFAAKPTVFYYSTQSAGTAENLANCLSQITGYPFTTQVGAGLGVPSGEEATTLFVHLVQ